MPSLPPPCACVLLGKLLHEFEGDRCAHLTEFVLHVGKFGRNADIGGSLCSPIIGQLDRKLLDSLALRLVVVERDGSVKFGKGVDGIGGVGVE